MKRPVGPAPRVQAAAPPPSKKERKATTLTRAEKKAAAAHAKAAPRAATAAPRSIPAATERSAPGRSAPRALPGRPATPAERKLGTASAPAAVKKDRATPALRAARARKEPDDAAIARRKLREATKARKAFERDEVRRFTAHLRRRRQAWTAIAASLGAVLLFVAIGVFTPVMALEDIQVTGTTRVSADEIKNALAPELGKPLPLVSQGVIQQAMESQILVKSYSTESLPPHTLLIKVVERAPVGYLPNSEGGFTIVDPAGVVIEKVTAKPAGIPLFSVADNNIAAPGFQAGIDVLQSLPASLAGQVGQVIAKTTDDVVIVLAGSGARVFWGGPDNAALKSKVLASLLATNPVGSVREYDVSSPKTAVVR
jgi:cell division protein FtsQ